MPEAGGVRTASSSTPVVHDGVDDLDTPLTPLLRSLPGVAKVEVLVAVKPPAQRIGHVRDWHYVPQDLYTADLRSSSKTALSVSPNRLPA